MASKAWLLGRLREPYEQALSAQVERVGRDAVRIWQVVGVGGVAGGLAYATWVSTPLGLGCAAASLTFLLWFSVAALLLDHGIGTHAVGLANTIVEALMPWAFAAVVVFTQGAAYALASWVPPMLFCALIVTYAGRLRALPPLLVGVTGAIAYPLLYWLVIQRRLPPDAASFLINQPATQISRSITLALGGLLGSLVAAGARRLAGRAEVAVREQDLFGKYRLLRQVASGGMGTVHEALYCPEGGFQRRVAVKRIHVHLAQKQRFVDSFRSEAELCSRLAHHNIVQVLDFGKVGDTFFLAMEYVDGLTLSRFMKRAFRKTRVTPSLVGHLLREILAGLDHAHTVARSADGSPLRVIHRDVCPQNVLLSSNGDVKSSDLGVARALRDAATTHTQTVAGHLAYMAPEQARAAPLDERVDHFPVGIIAWELLAGSRLFLRDNDAATLAALVSGEIYPPSSIQRDVGAAWDSFVLRALAREPADRFQSAREMAAALDAIPDSRGDRAAEALAAMIADLEKEVEPEQAEVPTETMSSGPTTVRSDAKHDAVS